MPWKTKTIERRLKEEEEEEEDDDAGKENSSLFDAFSSSSSSSSLFGRALPTIHLGSESATRIIREQREI